MGSRSYNRPSNVIALLFILLAFMDGFAGLVNMQIPAAGSKNAASAVCPSFGLLATAPCGAANGGWYADIFVAVVLAVIAALLLLRPERLVYSAAAGWSLIAFFGNLVARNTSGVDYLVTIRCTTYIVTFTIAVVLALFEWKAYMDTMAAQKASAEAETAAVNRAAGIAAASAAKSISPKPAAPRRR